MAHYKHAKDCELVIGIVAPVGVNLDNVQHLLESFIKQFQYEFNFIHLRSYSKSF